MAFDFETVENTDDKLTLGSIIAKTLESKYGNLNSAQEYYNTITPLHINSALNADITTLFNKKHHIFKKYSAILYDGQYINIPFIRYTFTPLIQTEGEAGIDLCYLYNFLKNTLNYKIINKNSPGFLNIELFHIWNNYKNDYIHLVQNILHDKEGYYEMIRGQEIINTINSTFFNNIYIQSDYKIMLGFMPYYKQFGPSMRLGTIPTIFYLNLDTKQ